MENDKIFTNGVATNKDFVNGGKFFSIPPGESTIIINQSAFNHTPPSSRTDMEGELFIMLINIHDSHLERLAF